MIICCFVGLIIRGAQDWLCSDNFSVQISQTVTYFGDGRNACSGPTRECEQTYELRESNGICRSVRDRYGSGIEFRLEID